MQIQCRCGTVKAELKQFPNNSPGWLGCYCQDCQNYLEKTGNSELMDSYGGCEIIPVYPSDIHFLSGKESLKCNVLTESGLHRWSTTCCHTPFGNTQPKFPWVGLLPIVFAAHGPSFLKENFGKVRSRVWGRDAKSKPPQPTAKTMNLKAVVTVAPFLLKGFFGKKYQGSPYFKEDNVTPISKPVLLI